MTSTTSLPSNIKALQTQPTEPQTVKVVSIPFSTDPQVSNLASDEVIVKERAVAINPTGKFDELLDFLQVHNQTLSSKLRCGADLLDLRHSFLPTSDWKHAAGMWGEPHRICGCEY